MSIITTPAARLRSALRMALAATSACLGMGLLMWFLITGPAQQVGTAMIWAGLALLVLIPVLNVIAVLLDEWSVKPRTFAWAAAGVLLLLVVSTLYKIWKSGSL
jgi:uncharacterized membrane protein